jgi:hypothetical protein
METKSKLWIGRIFIGAVLMMNIQSALVFFIDPARYAPAYELIGIPGEAAIRGYGVLFLMWNVPYVVALIHPLKNRISLYEAIAMQTIGLLGESFIYFQLPPVHSILGSSILRFVIFDGGGLILLILAGWFSREKNQLLMS